MDAALWRSPDDPIWFHLRNNDIRSAIDLIDQGELFSDLAIRDAIAVCKSGEVLEAMFEQGLVVDYNLVLASGKYSLLEFAVTYEAEDCVRVLLEAGANVSMIHELFPPVVDCSMSRELSVVNDEHGLSSFKKYIILQSLLAAGATIETEFTCDQCCE